MGILPYMREADVAKISNFGFTSPDHKRYNAKRYCSKKHPMVSITDLEFAIAIILITASIAAWKHSKNNSVRPQPKIRHMIDNTSVQSWLTKPCKTSTNSKQLTSILCSLFLHNPNISIEPVYINTKLNTLADAISRLKQPPDKNAYTDLSNTFPQIHSYRQFHPSAETLSEIFSVLLCHHVPGIIPKRALGHFTPARNTTLSSVPATI